ncbi:MULTISPECIES: helix-turn-helix domain-containing protein [Prauserella salsuginis group]|uniref:Helix-turn-helix domain-containing protein n=1 Tax=Prauserella salsuginis TaxID=387889 RepID=A0ABW6FWP2_9PSEU|nr:MULTISPECIES: helix-turn-helix transcriptional regulator [Prauserella salsuginis group]
MTVGPLLREWRTRRRLSQLELSTQLGVSARHISFVETGRSGASRGLLLQFAEHLDVPLRARNELLLAAGYAPAFGEHRLGDGAMEPVRRAIDTVLTAHEPHPALSVDDCWNIVAANSGSTLLLEDVAPELLTAPLNVLRLTLHPNGLAPRLSNLPQLRTSLLHKVDRQATLSGDPRLAELYTELVSYGEPPHAGERNGGDSNGETAYGGDAHNGRSSGGAPATDDRVFLPVRLRVADLELQLISTVTTFGTPLDTTVAGLSMESFFPADATTAEFLRRHSDTGATRLERLATEHPHLVQYLAGS